MLLTILLKMSKISTFIAFWFSKPPTILCIMTWMSTILATWARIGFWSWRNILEMITRRMLFIRLLILGEIGLIQFLFIDSRFMSQIFLFNNSNEFLRMDKLLWVGFFHINMTTNIRFSEDVPRGSDEAIWASNWVSEIYNLHRQKDWVIPITPLAYYDAQHLYLPLPRCHGSSWKQP